MLRYKDFEAKIKTLSEDGFMRWVYILPAVPVHLRNRFITTMEFGVDIPDAYDYIMTSQTIHDKEYLVFLEQALQSKDKV